MVTSAPARRPTVVAGYRSEGGHHGTHASSAPSIGGARRAGYSLAIVFSAALLIVLNGSPGWQAIPFLTSDTAQVLWLVNLSLAAGTTVAAAAPAEAEGTAATDQ